jgi:hypothetical protein
LARELRALEAQPLASSEGAGGDIAELVLLRHAALHAIWTLSRRHSRAFLTGDAANADPKFHEPSCDLLPEISFDEQKLRFNEESGQIVGIDESKSGNKAGKSLHLENVEHSLFITWEAY